MLYCVCVSFLTTSCVVTKTISVALLLYPGLGLAALALRRVAQIKVVNERIHSLGTDLTTETLAQAADDALFSAVQNNDLHVLRGLCPVQREPLYTFPQRAHNFTLPDKDSMNFIRRMLYKTMY